MAEIEFTLDAATGELTLHVKGVVGPTCDECPASRPKPDRAVVARRGDVAVGRERDAVYRLGVPLKGGELPASGRLPQIYGPVVASGGDGLAVRRESHAEDPTRVPLEGVEPLTGYHLPQLDRRVVAARGPRGRSRVGQGEASALQSLRGLLRQHRAVRPWCWPDNCPAVIRSVRSLQIVRKVVWFEPGGGIWPG